MLRNFLRTSRCSSSMFTWGTLTFGGNLESCWGHSSLKRPIQLRCLMVWQGTNISALMHAGRRRFWGGWQTSSLCLKDSTWLLRSLIISGVLPASSWALVSRWHSLRPHTPNEMRLSLTFMLGIINRWSLTTDLCSMLPTSVVIAMPAFGHTVYCILQYTSPYKIHYS